MNDELTDTVVRELIRRFHDRNAVEALLTRAGFPVARLQPNASAEDVWRFVEEECNGGASDPAAVINQALVRYPHNRVFRNWLSGRTSPDTEPPAPPPAVRGPQPGSPPPAASPPTSRAPQTTPPPPDAPRPATGYMVIVTAAGLTTTQVLAAARAVLGRDGVPPLPVEIGLANESLVALELPTATADDAARVADHLARQLGISPRRVTVRANTFRDYFLERLVLEGPDERRFEVPDVPASTPLRDLGRGLTGQYQDANWPADRNGKPKETVVSVIGPGGGPPRQLNADQNLHDSHVADGSTLRFHPQATAGVNPVQREEALARVQSQVQAFAAANPRMSPPRGNATQKPTTYLLEFTAPGFAPADGPGPPRPIDRHVVRIDLMPEFPMAAPLVHWQTPVFHPNIDPTTGKVCLGVLEENYRPSLDFGALLQTIVDIAGYQNFEAGNGYNTDAQRWALSDEGHAAIDARGGRSVLRALLTEYLDAAHDPPPLKFRELH